MYVYRYVYIYIICLCIHTYIYIQIKYNYGWGFHKEKDPFLALFLATLPRSGWIWGACGHWAMHHSWPSAVCGMNRPWPWTVRTRRRPCWAVVTRWDLTLSPMITGNDPHEDIWWSDIYVYIYIFTYYIYICIYIYIYINVFIYLSPLYFVQLIWLGQSWPGLAWPAASGGQKNTQAPKSNWLVEWLGGFTLW